MLMKIKWWWIVPAALLLVIGADRLVDALLHWQLEKVATAAAGPGASVELGRVRADLFSGTLEVHGLVLGYDSMAVDSLLSGMRRSLVAVDTDRLLLSGLSYLELFRHGAVRLDRIEVDGASIHHYFTPKGEEDTTTASSENAPGMPALITVDTLIVREAHGSSQDITGKRPSAALANLHIRAGGIRVIHDPNGSIRFMLRSARIEAMDVHAALPPLYDLHIATLTLNHPAGHAELTGLRFQPRHNEQQYHSVLPYETDLFQAAVDTLGMKGIDVARFLSDNALHVDHLTMNGVVFNIYRDKTMRNGPWRHKPLPTRALRELDWSLKVDTLHLQRGLITYHERDTLSPDYGSLAFTDVEATILGINNTPRYLSEGGELLVSATAGLEDRSTVNLELSSVIAAENDAFTIRARVGSLPFTVFNRMTDSLLQVEATGGRIHSLELWMEGNDRSAEGTLDLVYEDLKINFTRPGKDRRNELVGFVANTLVRTNNLKDKGRYRQAFFKIDRRRDRSIFNFLWNAVKAGAMDTVVPGVVRTKDSKQKARKARKDERR